MGLGEGLPGVCGNGAVADLVGVDVMGSSGVVVSVESTQQPLEMRVEP